MVKGDFEVCVTTLSAVALLEDENLWRSWQIFEKGTPPATFFSSSSHVRQWLSTMPEKTLMAISVLLDGEGKLAGVTLFGVKRIAVFRFIPLISISLLRTQNSKLDQCWPEYVHPVCRDDAKGAVGWWLAQTQIKLNAHIMTTEVVPLSWLKEWSVSAPFGYQVLAENIEDGGEINIVQGKKWSSSISRQCRQTERYAKNKWGDIELQEVISPENKRQVLYDAAPWHIQKWEATDTPSGFLNEKFNACLKGWSELCGDYRMRVFIAKAGGEFVGVHVIITSHRWAGYYLSALKPESGNHWHIGTWLHVSVYDFLLKEGQVDVYDFMAGDARYKSQMRDKNTVYGRGVWFNSTVLSGKMIALAAKIKMWWSLKYRGNRCNIIKRY